MLSKILIYERQNSELIRWNWNQIMRLYNKVPLPAVCSCISCFSAGEKGLDPVWTTECYKVILILILIIQIFIEISLISFLVSFFSLFVHWLPQQVNSEQRGYCEIWKCSWVNFVRSYGFYKSNAACEKCIIDKSNIYFLYISKTFK